MSEEPKIIYKYTHARAVADGDLRILDWPVADRMTLYISRNADALFPPEEEKDNCLAGAVALALIMDNDTDTGKRLKCAHNGIDYQVALGFEIRDDDKQMPICTIVAPGEL
jgi:hypothetical protein